MITREDIEKLASDAHEQNVQKMVVGAVIVKDGKVLIVKRAAEEDFMAGLEEIPSGTVDPGESLDGTLSRELNEETGLRLNAIEKYVNHFDYLSGSGKRTRQFNFLVSVKEGEVVLNSKEHSGHRWLLPNSREFEDANISRETKHSVVLALAGQQQTWVAIDGVDATGKGTQVRSLKERNNSIVTIDEFSKSEVGTLISSNIAKNQFFSLREPGKAVKTETALLVADALFKSECEFDKAKNESELIVSDRGLLSIIAYQAVRLGQTGMQISQALQWAENFVDVAFNHAKKPDLNIILMAPIEEVTKRCASRGDKLDLAAQKFLSDAQQIMIELAKKRANNAEVIEVSGLSIEELSTNIEKVISNKTDLKIGPM